MVGKQVTYTNNWPSEPLVGNTPPPALWVWSAFSVLFLIAGIALLGWHYAVTHGAARTPHTLPATRSARDAAHHASMRATAKYFWVVLALFLAQILLGAITAHYQVEGQEAYGFALSEYLPYSLTRTWHTQLAVLWIAAAWLGTGLYIAPALSGHEPKFQRLGVNFLFVCLLVIVVGSFAGQWFAVMQKLGLDHNFWFGHQGWEYADMGRFWQWFLFVGLLLWVTLVGRALWPVLRGPATDRQVDRRPAVPVHRGIGLFFGAALMWGEHTHISEVEYWRWWLVHLWVEGFFEVFATAVMALIFTRLGLMQDDDRDGRGAVRHHRVHGRRRARHPAPPVLRRHADRGGGAGRELQRAGSGAAGLHRLRGVPHLQAGQGHAVDGALPLADHVLHRGVVLEPGRRGPVRLPDQPAAVAVLHAGPEPDAAARPHRAVRRVRHARHRAGAVLPARPARADGVGRAAAEGGVLVRSTSAWR